MKAENKNNAINKEIWLYGAVYLWNIQKAYLELFHKCLGQCFSWTLKKILYILSRVKQITSPGWMHETSARGWCTGKTQRDGNGEGGGRGGSGSQTHVNPWLIHVNVWQKPLQYCKVISLQLIKINGKKFKKYYEQQGNLHNSRDFSLLLFTSKLK